MSYNDYMYAVDRSDEYLAHYGVKGMKWGVRKAIDRGDAKALLRHYRKASKKLAKLQKRAASGAKYSSRAKKLAAGAAVAGGLAAVGADNIGRAVSTVGGATRTVGRRMRDFGDAMVTSSGRGKVGKIQRQVGHALGAAGRATDKVTGKNVARAGLDVQRWANSNSVSAGVGKKVEQAITRQGLKNNNLAVATQRGMNANKAISGVSNNTIARIGAGAVGAGLAGAAGYNAYRAATTKKAAQKAANFQREMNQAFKGTKYANGGQGSKSSSGNGNRKRRRNRG